MRDVFGYEFDEIAETIDKPPAACRQLAVRARRAIREGRPRRAADRAERRRLADALFKAAQAGNVEALTRLLAEDARFASATAGREAAV